MLAANCIDKSELPDFDESTGLLPKEEDDGINNFILLLTEINLLLMTDFNSSYICYFCWSVAELVKCQYILDLLEQKFHCNKLFSISK